MKRSAIIASVGLWLFFWANDTGVLVASVHNAEYRERTCYYLIGLSVVRKMIGDYGGGRCSLLSRV